MSLSNYTLVRQLGRGHTTQAQQQAGGRTRRAGSGGRRQRPRDEHRARSDAPLACMHACLWQRDRSRRTHSRKSIAEASLANLSSSLRLSLTLSRARVFVPGNFGVVSVVRSRLDSRLYVLKEIDLRSLTADVKRAALGEAQLLSSLQHPCIVGYIESFITDEPPLDAADAAGKPAAGPGSSSSSPSGSSSGRDTLCIVMEFAAGGDLGEVIRKLKSSGGAAGASPNSPPFPEDQILDWFIQLALALKYIHSHHILHRDLKAQNVFLTADSRVKLGSGLTIGHATAVAANREGASAHSRTRFGVFVGATNSLTHSPPVCVGVSRSDFGISKVLNSEADFAKTVIGTVRAREGGAKQKTRPGRVLRWSCVCERDSDLSFLCVSCVALLQPYYLSPEICEGKDYGKKSDVWSLGT